MAETTKDLVGVVLDEALTVTLAELSEVCRASDQTVRLMVHEGLLRPLGQRPDQWRFTGAEIRRARRAVRLQRDLELNLAGAALALDLLDQIDALHARIRALEFQLGPHTEE